MGGAKSGDMYGGERWLRASKEKGRENGKKGWRARDGLSAIRCR